MVGTPCGDPSGWAGIFSVIDGDDARDHNDGSLRVKSAEEPISPLEYQLVERWSKSAIKPCVVKRFTSPQPVPMEPHTAKNTNVLLTYT